MVKNPIKIKYLMDYFAGVQGGTESQVMQLITRLERTRFDPSITFFRWTDYLKEKGFVCQFDILNVRKLISIDTFRKLARLSNTLRQSGTKLVHIFFNDAALSMPLFGKLGGAKVVVSRRDMGFWYTTANLSLLRFSNLFVDKIVANSYSVKENVVVNERFPAKLVDVIYNGLDSQKFAVPAEKDFFTLIGYDLKGPLVGMVSNLYDIKRPFDLIKAFSIIAQEFGQSHLVFVGGGPREINPLKQLAGSLRLEHRIHFIGRVPDPVSIIKHFAVCVLCSESEGMSNAILEYLGCGKPVVCTDVGGNPELIQDGYNGFLVDVGDVKALADKISQILHDPHLASELGKNARKSFGEAFTANKMAQSYMELYENLLRGHRDEINLNSKFFSKPMSN
jgi:glycosyltransferase involved in cell wall biosynthesis